MSEKDGGGEDSQGAVLVEFLKVVEPAISAVQDGPHSVLMLLDDIGISEDVLGQDAATLYESMESDVSSNGGQIVETVTGMVEETDSVDSIDSLSEIDDVDWGEVLKEVDLKDLKSVGESAKAIYDSFEALTEVDLQFDEEDVGVESLGDAVMDYLLIRYLRTYHGQVYGWCKTFGVITSEVPGQERPETIDLGILVDAVEDPNEMPKEVFGWGTEASKFLATLLLERLMTAFWGMDVPAKMPGLGDEELANAASLDSPDDVADLATEGIDGFGNKLLIPLIGYQVAEGNRFETGLKLVPLPPTGSAPIPGLALVTYGTLAGDMTGDLGGDWELAVDGDGNLANRGVAIRPSTDGITTEFVNVEGTDATAAGTESEDQLVWSMDLTYVGPGEKTAGTVLGTMAGSLEMDGLEITTDFEYTNDQVRFAAELTTTGTFSIDPQGGFLDKVVPEPVEYDFDVTAGWSTVSGFYLQNGGTLEMALADNIPLGPLNVKETFLGLELPETGGDSGVGASDDPPALPLSVAGSPELDLGFMTARVNRMGLQNTFTFPEDGGNLGPADHELGFRPPDGIALSVDAGPVSGGGVLNFYPEEKRYSGVLQLQVGKLSVDAVGLLKTELPGGRDGYSLLLLITAEFPPVQLSFGFTLNGLGGILGIHRSVKRKPMGDAVKNGNVDAVLFPENIVENADRIISDLRTIFPPTADQHVAGPMAKFGWGTPTLLKMEVGVVLQFPEFKVVIVGAFHLHLPDEAAPLVELHLAVMGFIDPPNEMLSVRATLYDSRLVLWTISGGMAMRLHWGEDAKFLLSVGGFNPRYEPPSGFPEVDRVKASLGPPSGNPRLELKGYLATTPNTFQVGAGVYLHAEAGPASVKGELSFDALFQFDPFKFIIDFLAWLEVKVWGKGLSLELDGTLKGPGPMSVSGTVKVTLMGFEVQEDIDVTLGSGGGDEEGLPPAEVMPELLDELERPGNWSAQLPKANRALVTVSGPGADEEGRENGEDSDDTVLVHPLGGLSVRQQTVPLKMPVEKYGNAVPRDYRKFRIEAVLVDGTELDEPTGNRERFAPAKYQKMSDSEKMNSPPFVLREAGVETGGSLVYYPGHDAEAGLEDPEARATNRAATLEYETTVVDEERETHGAPMATLGSYTHMSDGEAKAAARVGMPLDEVSAVLGETAVAEVEHRQDFETARPPVYGVPDGYVVGERGATGEQSSPRAAVSDAATTVDGSADGTDGDTASAGLVHGGSGVTNFDSEEDE